jgi:hypothetical protein
MNRSNANPRHGAPEITVVGRVAGANQALQAPEWMRRASVADHAVAAATVRSLKARTLEIELPAGTSKSWAAELPERQ